MPSLTPSTFSLPRPHSPASRASDWRPGLDRSSAALLVLALHVMAILGLLRFGWHAVRAVAPTPVSIGLLTEALPKAQTALPTASARVPMPNWSTSSLPVPEVAMVHSASPEALSLPVQPALQAPAPAPIAAATSEPSPRAAPAQPKPINASSLRYRVEPAVEVPRLSRRAGEQGRVALRVVFDAEGRPRDVHVLRGSGFARLDAQAIEAMQAARINPYLEDGRAIEVMAVATLEYQLD